MGGNSGRCSEGIRDLFIAAAEGRPIPLRSTGASIANVIARTAKPSDVTDLNARALAGKVSTICGALGCCES